MSDDQADERPQQQATVVDITTAGGVNVTIKAYEPLAAVAATAATLLHQAGHAGQHRPVGFAAGGTVHLEQPCTYPAEPHAAAPAPPPIDKDTTAP